MKQSVLLPSQETSSSFPKLWKAEQRMLLWLAVSNDHGTSIHRVRRHTVSFFWGSFPRIQSLGLVA
jgi:hypothetical protein